MGELVEEMIAVEELTQTALEPFGELISPALVEQSAAPEQAGGHRMAELELAIDGMPALFVIRYPEQDMVVSAFERHLTMTEVRLALDSAAVLAVAGPPIGEEPADRPTRDSLRAFLIHFGAGVLLHRGTWHALSCFPVDAPFSSFAFLTERQSEFELQSRNVTPRRTDFYDFADEGAAFRIVDPAGLL
jgi:ureidoglycolate hydrolase